MSGMALSRAAEVVDGQDAGVVEIARLFPALLGNEGKARAHGSLLGIGNDVVPYPTQACSHDLAKA